MNLEEKRQEVGSRVMVADDVQLDAVLELLNTISSAMHVSEDDSAQLNYANKSKRFRVLSLIQNVGESELDSILWTLPPAPEFELSEEDLAIIKERQRRYEAGETKMLDAFESLERLRAKLKENKK